MASSALRTAVPRRSWAARFRRRQRLMGSLWAVRFIHIVRPVAVGWLVARAGARVFNEMRRRPGEVSIGQWSNPA
jgi:hypothetical protein